MHSVILVAPHLDRDIRHLLKYVPSPQVLTGEKTPRGEDGCLDLHLAAIITAQQRLWPMVWVMEDDCAFTAHFTYDRWCIDARWAQGHGYDVLVGGSTRTYDERSVREGLLEVSAFHSAHCVVYFARAYEKIVRHAAQPYDLSLGRECGCRVALVHPFVAVQRPSFSGILQQQVDYVPLYAEHEERLQKVVMQ